jgi:hypothetical protein
MIFKEIVNPLEKGFKKNIEGYTEHASAVNFLKSDARARKRNIYVAPLDCRDAFGSVSRELLEKNVRNLKVSEFLKNQIIDNYKNVTVEIFTKTNCTPPIKILR